jgi:hypothetical protein
VIGQHYRLTFKTSNTIAKEDGASGPKEARKGRELCQFPEYRNI